MQNLFENGPKKVFLETFGCQMNDNDSERILGLLEGIDYSRTDAPGDADLIIINTCSVRDKAEQKVYSTLGRFKALKDENPGLIIGVSGCVAQQQGEALLKRAPYLDLVFGPHNIHKLKELIIGASGRGRVVATAQSETIEDDEYGYYPRSADGIKAFVSIMRGCNNFCAYCIVPYTRGREVSRKSADIIEEVKRLRDSGVMEVTLLGQNVNSYGAGGGDVSFPELLTMVAGVQGVKRVRFVTSHPKDISRELIDLFASEPKLCRHIHLPVQSGSNAVLKNMGRVYTREDYLEKVELMKGLYPDMTFTSDIIVGFPGESDEDFLQTMDLLERVRFENLFSFMYSPRPNTRAATFGAQVPLEVKSRRLKLLQEAQRAISAAKCAGLVGRTLEVLVEGPSKASADELTGRTNCNKVVNFPVPAGLGGLEGSVTSLVITRAFPNSLRAIYKERS